MKNILQQAAAAATGSKQTTAMGALALVALLFEMDLDPAQLTAVTALVKEHGIRAVLAILAVGLILSKDGDK